MYRLSSKSLGEQQHPRREGVRIQQFLTKLKTRVMSAITELAPRKKTGRGRKSLSPSVRDNCRLCVKFGSQRDQIGTENLQFQPSKQTGSFDVILAKLYA